MPNYYAYQVKQLASVSTRKTTIISNYPLPKQCIGNNRNNKNLIKNVIFVERSKNYQNMRQDKFITILLIIEKIIIINIFCLLFSWIHIFKSLRR